MAQPPLLTYEGIGVNPEIEGEFAANFPLVARVLPFVDRERCGAVVQRVEQELVGPTHLRTELRPDRKKNHAAAADRNIGYGSLAVQFLLTENESAHERIR